MFQKGRLNIFSTENSQRSQITPVGVTDALVETLHPRGRKVTEQDSGKGVSQRMRC